MKLIDENYIIEDNIQDEWDKAWEQKFGPDDKIEVLSADDALKLLDEMENF